MVRVFAPTVRGARTSGVLEGLGVLAGLGVLIGFVARFFLFFLLVRVGVGLYFLLGLGVRRERRGEAMVVLIACIGAIADLLLVLLLLLQLLVRR